MIKIGGIPLQYVFFDKLDLYEDITFIIPGSSDIAQKRHNLVMLPHRSDFFHPDLINASDAVIGKVGYSTLAEVYNSGVPFGYILRPQFPESNSLYEFISKEMKGIKISENANFRYRIGMSFNNITEHLCPFASHDDRDIITILYCIRNNTHQFNQDHFVQQKKCKADWRI